MYKIIAIAGLIIRQFFLPNPFEPFGVCGQLYNMIAGLVFGLISYISVGVFYEIGSAPVIGSFLYTFFFALYSSELWLSLKLYPNKVLVVMIASLLVLIDIYSIRFIRKNLVD